MISIQPTTKFVQESPIVNTDNFVLKKDLVTELAKKADKSALDTKTDSKDVERISTNLIAANLTDYCKKDELNKGLENKSNTNHTHTTINNDLTINSKRLNLYSSNAYTYFTFGKNGKDGESAVLGFGDDKEGKYAFIRVNGGKQLSIFNDKATFPSEFTVSTLNGIDPSTISLNTHNHDDKYALLSHSHTTNDITDIDTLAKADHNHDAVYATLTHAHSYNSLTGIPETFTPSEHNHDDKYASKEHTHSFNDLEDKPELALANHTHTEFNNNIVIKGNLDVKKISDIRVPPLSDGSMYWYAEEPFYPYVDSKGNCNIGNSLTFISDEGTFNCIKFDVERVTAYANLNMYDNINYKFMSLGDKAVKGEKHTFLNFGNSLGFYGDNETSLSIRKQDDTKLFSFGEDKNRPDTQAVDTYLEFNRSDSTASYEWRIYSLSNHNLDFVNYQGKRAGYINCISNNQMNTTITHNAPLTEDLDKYEIGAPVFMSGKVYKLEDGKYINETDSINCIPSVKPTGYYKEFLGIVVAKHKKGDKITIGDVVKRDIIIQQDTIDFATHGDFYFKVRDSWPYQPGDIILYDGNIVRESQPITTRIQRMIVGVVTAIIDPDTVAIFKD